jgi:hypothetical protein
MSVVLARFLLYSIYSHQCKSIRRNNNTESQTVCSKHLPNAGVRFLENSMLGKSMMGKLNTLWFKWGYETAAT